MPPSYYPGVVSVTPHTNRVRSATCADRYSSGENMIRKLRTQRDNQQWMLDLALNMRGRVQNFERDDLEVPAGKRARNYRMLPKLWREAAERHEKLAKRAQARDATQNDKVHYGHE